MKNCWIIFVSILICECVMANMQMGMNNDEKTFTISELKLRNAMRKLWTDHIVFTREYIDSAVDNRPGTKTILNRLLRNQDDIGGALQPYYGQEAAEKLTSLLREHIVIAGDVVAAAAKDEATTLSQANKKWHINADEISAFLSKANQSWRYKDLKNMMYDHLQVTTEEAQSRIKLDWNAWIENYDKVYAQILEMADMLSEGVISQFPDKFR